MSSNAAGRGGAVPERPKPHILLLCDTRGWAYDTTARNLASRLSDDYDFEILYVDERPEIDERKYDLIYVFWWGERYHRRFVSSPAKVVKEISSHRWELEPRYGRHTAAEALERYLHDAGHLVTTSEKLLALFKDLHPRVFHYSLGVDGDFFRPLGARSEGAAERGGASAESEDSGRTTGEAESRLSIGWAGRMDDPKKRVREILMPACGDRFRLELADASLTREELLDLYNRVDVICVCSTEEGTPLPLIEGMACGCFPVSTDVGVAAELISNGENGLIVEPTAEAFRAAFEWCEANLARVRAAGLENARRIRRERSWDVSASRFGEILESVLLFNEAQPTPAAGEREGPDYDRHFERINPAGFSDSTYRASCRYFAEDIEPLLPRDEHARILEVGTGFGHFLRYLADAGYRRVSGIDLSEALLQGVRARLADRVERLEVADALAFLPAADGVYDCIVMLDMLEHVSKARAEELLAAARRALKPGGRLILRTPNMANLLGAYSLYMDATHLHGYTEWSLLQLLEQAGFERAAVHVPKRFATWKRRLFAALNRHIHQWIFRINDKAAPRWFGKNVVVWADR